MIHFAQLKSTTDFLQENKQVVAEVEPMSDTFYPAEKYHQDYWAKWGFPLVVVSLALVGKFTELNYN